MVDSAGIHHVTAICGDPKRNHDFYTRSLGLRLVKKTVNFDDPSTYHLYFGDDRGSPGTAITFFPWPAAAPGRLGSGEAQATAFLAPRASLAFWQARLAKLGPLPPAQSKRFGEDVLAFADPDGMALEIVAAGDAGTGAAAAGSQVLHENVPHEHALLGFHGVTLGLNDPDGTAAVLAAAFGWRKVGAEGGRERYETPRAATALGRHVDLTRMSGPRGRQGRGSVHHIAFRAGSDAEQAAMADALAGLGLAATEQKDRF